ncbi:MAG TPA: glycosyltransferase [Candidatus Thermoplasmatota archaeon]|nr:glycosyltransferase [Candidatus Thermoplasmatota archaeon]
MDPVSVILTVRDEARHLPHLLDSLVPQRQVREVILVDAMSTDRTVAIAESYRDLLPRLRIVQEPCHRGQGRNIGAALASGDLLAFTDGDCITNPFWTERLAHAWAKAPDRIVAGQTILTGFWAFAKLDRVELPHLGQDTTWPSCNLAYPRRLFEAVGGFDPGFVTAEDIDLNFRAVAHGAHIVHAPDAIVYARARDSVGGFMRQAYWNGYGRKQLTQKHGSLWKDYRLSRMARIHGASAWSLLRLGAGLVGYLDAKMGRLPPAHRPAPGHRNV